jgi:hypothetical protein
VNPDVVNPDVASRDVMNRTLSTTVARAFRRMALPLSAYYAVTLAAPLANGAARSGAVFVDHALIVLIIPPALIVLASTFYVATGIIRASATNRGASPVRLGRH